MMNGRTIVQFIRTIQVDAGRLVVDKTGLTGLYDIELETELVRRQGLPATLFQTDTPPQGLSLFTALQEQLTSVFRRTRPRNYSKPARRTRCFVSGGSCPFRVIRLMPPPSQRMRVTGVSSHGRRELRRPSIRDRPDALRQRPASRISECLWRWLKPPEDSARRTID